MKSSQMKPLKLAKLPDRIPVKMTVTLMPDLAAALKDYAELYAEAYGAREDPAELVPFMLKAFLAGDGLFRKTRNMRKEHSPREDGENRTREAGRGRRLGRISSAPSALLTGTDETEG